ncbi:MAG TPA: hypothetical protein VFO58_22845 [Vicinamibacterales bacterium]|nr:hypothetical protein [Vicinamibacterales bacterium]
MSENTRTGPKKPYAAPRLVTYGDIAQLTQNSPSAKQKADGGGKLKTKTI